MSVVKANERLVFASACRVCLNSRDKLVCYLSQICKLCAGNSLIWTSLLGVMSSFLRKYANKWCSQGIVLGGGWFRWALGLQTCLHAMSLKGRPGIAHSISRLSEGFIQQLEISSRSKLHVKSLARAPQPGRLVHDQNPSCIIHRLDFLANGL